MPVIELLQRSELFSALTPAQVKRIAALGREIVYNAGDVIIREGEPTSEIYIIQGGMVEVVIAGGAIPDVSGTPHVISLVRLGQGQLFGEMALVDQGARSATVRCVEDGTALYAIPHQALRTLCDGDHDVGYILMRNVAADLSFKLRHRNLQVRLEGGAT